jgi:Arc/MetJ-type ribon-helix-helix transcriptional regulator
MGAIQIPDQLKQIIDRQVAAGRAASEADYVQEALRAYADHLDAEFEIAGMAGRADADMAAGRFVTVTDVEDREARHASTMARLRENLAADSWWR